MGFTLERQALNVVCVERPDNSGHTPGQGRIGDADCWPSRLPLAAIEAALAARGLPVALSESAGDYLCNFLFYLSCCGSVPHFAPRMAGFIHVPPVGDEQAEPAFALTEADLFEGALVVIRTCCNAWKNQAKNASPDQYLVR